MDNLIAILILIRDDPPGTWTVDAISASIDEPVGMTRALVDDLLSWGLVYRLGHTDHLAPTPSGKRSLLPLVGRQPAEA